MDTPEHGGVAPTLPGAHDDSTSDLQQARWQLLALVGMILAVLSAIDCVFVTLWYYTRIEVSANIDVRNSRRERTCR